MKCGAGGERARPRSRGAFAPKSCKARPKCLWRSQTTSNAFALRGISSHEHLHQEAMSQVQSLPDRGIPPIIINFQ